MVFPQGRGDAYCLGSPAPQALPQAEGFGSAGLGSPAPQAEPQAEAALAVCLQPAKLLSPVMMYFLLERYF